MELKDDFSEQSLNIEPQETRLESEQLSSPAAASPQPESNEIAAAEEMLRHNLLEYEEAMRLEPAWRERPFQELQDAVDSDSALMRKLAPLGIRQEAEADREGLKLAWRVGWPAPMLARYFQKLARSSLAPNFEQVAHPAPSQRWNAAQELAATLEAAGR